MQVPEFMPDIKAGYHRAPESGGCVMQVVHFLWEEGWTDRPECTDGGLASIAIMLNDSVTDDARRGLLAAVPDLIGTAWLVDEAGLSEEDEDAAIDELNEWVAATMPYGAPVEEKFCDDCAERWGCLTDRITHMFGVKTSINGDCPNLAPWIGVPATMSEREEIELAREVFGLSVADVLERKPADWRERQHELVAWFVAFVRKYREVFGGQPGKDIETAEWQHVAKAMQPA